MQVITVIMMKYSHSLSKVGLQCHVQAYFRSLLLLRLCCLLSRALGRGGARGPSTL